MTRFSRAGLTILGACVLLPAMSSAAQTPPSAKPTAPIYKTELITNTDSGVFANIYNIHILSDGSVLVVDATRRRLLVLDSSLKKFTIAADTAGEGAVGFGATAGGLIPYIGDSAAFLDLTAGALVTVDRNGRFGRATSLPRPSDMGYLGGPAYGKPGFDTRGRLFYRPALPPMFPMFGTRDTTFASPDTAPIIRADLDARRLDTIAWMRVPFTKYKTYSREGQMVPAAVANPIPVIDDWAYDRDGTVAIVRGHDYHIDWIMPDGSRRSTPKMPFNWRRITDDEKKQIVDSVTRRLDSLRSAAIDRVVAMQAQGGGGGARAGARPYSPPPTFVATPQELPDYYPAVKPSSRPRFDLDGNLWVIPGTVSVPVSDGGLVYDVIDRNGTLLKRVQIPPGRVLSGFGPGGLIYMTVSATFSWTRFERARIVPAGQ